MFPYELNDLPDKFAVLQRQEETIYKVPDYLAPSYIIRNPPEQEEQITPRKTIVDDALRQDIVHWCYKVVDYLNMNRNTVSVSISYFDRFLSVRTVNKKVAQLVGLTSLYLAIKLYEQEWKTRMPVVLSHFITLSRNNFTGSDIIGMEALILNTLNFHMHPPTPQTIVSQLLHMFPNHIDPLSLRDLVEHSNFLIEVSVTDSFFMTRKSSSIAVASLLVAMNNDPYISQDDRKTAMESVRQITNIDFHSIEVEECRTKLVVLYSERFDEEIADHHTEHNGHTYRTETVSPVSVAGISDQPMF